MLSARHLPKKYVFRNLDLIPTMVIIMLQFLSEGEEAELYKTFYSDMEYRLSICGDEGFHMSNSGFSMPIRMFSIQTRNRKYARTWDFKLQSSQQLRIVIKVPSSGQQGGTPASGCVAIMFGFKIKK